MLPVKTVRELQNAGRSVNGSNGSDTSFQDSAPTIAQVRKQLLLNGQNASGTGSREYFLKTMLGLNSCIIETDLNSADSVKSYLQGESIDRVNYFDSSDFLNGKLPDEGYTSVLMADGERRDIEALSPDEKRLYILRKAFGFNFDRYLNVFKDKLVRVARDIYKQALYDKLSSDPDSPTVYISDELPEEQNRPVKNFQNVNGTYKWAMDSLTEDRDSMVGIHRYLRNGDGQRKFVRDLINSQKLHHSNGDDSAMEYISAWIGRSPQSLLKARVVLEELIEDIPIGPNRLSFHLNSLEDKIRDSSQGTINSGWSWWNLIGMRGRHTAPGVKDGLTSLNEKPLPGFMVDLEDRIAVLAKDVFDEEKGIVEEIKMQRRRHFLKVASAWTGVGTVFSALGTGVTYWAVSSANAAYFNEKVTSIEEKVRPYRQLVYESFLNRARGNLPAFPAERRDPLDISGHEVWTNQNFAVEIQQFRMGICRDYSRPLGLCFIPELPRNVNMDGVPAFLRTNLSNCLRGLIPQDVWNSNQIGWIIGSSLETRYPVPDSRMRYFLGPQSAYRNSTDRSGLVSEPSEEVRMRGLAESVANARSLQGQQREDFINSHLQPRDFVDVDPDYINIVLGLRVFSDALKRRKFDVLVSGNQLSNEQYQELTAEGVDTGNITRFTIPQIIVENFQRFKGYEVFQALIRQFDLAKNNNDIAKIEQLEPLIDESIRTNSALYPPEEARVVMNHLALCEAILEKLNRALEIRYREIKSRNTYRARLINEEPMYTVLSR